uniref:ketopantoate reductase C-terminal domain-containing protein n=1 Tax=Alcanivorax sp. TaxID=1872427 RepID=UPI003BADBBA3
MGPDTLSILDAPGGEDLVRTMMKEVMAVAAADGYPLPDDLVEKNLAGTRK